MWHLGLLLLYLLHKCMGIPCVSARVRTIPRPSLVSLLGHFYVAFWSHLLYLSYHVCAREPFRGLSWYHFYDLM